MPTLFRITRRAFVAALCAGLFAPVVHTQQPQAARPALDDHYFESGGVKLRYVDVGQGEAVVLLHGFAAQLDLNWVRPKIVEKLSKDLRVIALDCRGHGKSDKPHGVEHYGTRMVSDVANLLDHLGIRRAHIVGYSMGGNIAAKFVTMYPERAATVTLGGGGGHRNRTSADDRDDEELAVSLEEGRGILPLLRRFVPKNEPAGPESALEQASRSVVARNDPLALAAVTRSRRQLVVTDAELTAVRAPLLAIVGTADPAIEHVDALKQLLPTLEVVTIRGATHVGPPRGAPARPEFVASVREFIGRHPTAPTP